MDYLLNNIVAMAISSYHSTPLLEHIFAKKSFCLKIEQILLFIIPTLNSFFLSNLEMFMPSTRDSFKDYMNLCYLLGHTDNSGVKK